MKNIKTLLLWSGMFASQVVAAQTNGHIKLSTDYPSAGEKITVTYDPTGTILDGKKDIEATVFYLDNKDFPVADIELKQNGRSLTGDFTVPANAKAFFIKPVSGADVDNNNGKGYLYPIYLNKQPVEGSYAMQGYFLAGMGAYYAGIKPESAQGVDLYRKEFELHPGIKKQYQRGYYSLIAMKPEYRADVDAAITRFKKSDDENELMLAMYLLKTVTGQNTDSLTAAIKAKFPNGTTVRREQEDVFDREEDVYKRDSIYHAFAKRFPEVAGDKSTSLERFRFQLTAGYLAKGDLNNYYKYKAQLNNTGGLPMALNGNAYAWAEANERLADAEKLAKESLDMLMEKINNPVGSPYTSPAQVKKSKLADYDACADTYAFVLAKENKFAEALKYEQPVIDRMKGFDASIYENYINILTGLGQSEKAKEYAETAIKNGAGNKAINTQLKAAYVKLNGSEKGFEEYFAPIRAIGHQKVMAFLAKTMINQPAPVFTLKDADGKTVALADLKGKIVIVDFWATWCGPCKASFPGMQMAVDKFKDNPDVKFLFIDTRETTPNYMDEVRKFIADNKYTFHVLFDENDAAGNQRKEINAYDVPGIPTKFIIDKTGNIRFKVVGYGGTPEELANDVTDMITIAGNPEAYQPGETSVAKKEGSR